MKRLLNCTSSDFKKMTGKELIQSIQASEGRVVLSEIVSAFPPLFREVTNVELACAFGADLILLNFFDVFSPEIKGMPKQNGSNIIKNLKHLIGRPIGINLEPVDKNAISLEDLNQLPEGRTASTRAIQKAKELGFDFICLTGNPKTGVTHQEIIKAIKITKEVVGDELFIIAGKMHNAGVAENADISIDKAVISYVAAGADVILLPSPGTVPGITVEQTQKWISYIHKQHALAMLAIGTSQEGSDQETIRQIALNNKMAGADIHHIGDAGYNGIAIPENIMTYSIAIRGRRHTYIRMASSINRTSE